MVFILIFTLSAVPVLANVTQVNDSNANTKLQNIYERLGSIYQNCLVPQYTIISNRFDTSLSTINTKLYDLIQDTLAVGGQVSDVSSKLVYTNQYLANIDSNTDYVETHLSNLNNINWINTNVISVNSVSQSFDQSDPLTANNSTTIAAGTYYVKLTPISYNEALINSNLYRIDLPFRASSTYYYSDFISDIKIISLSGSELTCDYYYTINQLGDSERYVSLYVYNVTYPNSSWFTLKIQFSKPWMYRVINRYIYYLDINNVDYYYVSQLINTNNINNSMSSIFNDIHTLKELYASDDLINAKDSQQNYEDAAITDFTGSGSAAANSNDQGALKNVSSSIRNGLNSGGNVSNTLNVFNSNSGLWDWFTQSNYNDINGEPTRGSTEYIDFYSTNREELERLLQEER